MHVAALAMDVCSAQTKSLRKSRLIKKTRSALADGRLETCATISNNIS